MKLSMFSYVLCMQNKFLSELLYYAFSSSPLAVGFFLLYIFGLNEDSPDFQTWNVTFCIVLKLNVLFFVDIENLIYIKPIFFKNVFYEKEISYDIRIYF